MRFGRRGGSAPAPVIGRRRTGPAGEHRWWDPDDQAWAEQPTVPAELFGRGWRTVPMMNNEERRDPLGSDSAADAIRAAWRARSATALDEGQAWRRHRDGALVVARVEVFAPSGDELVAAHRAAWQEHGEAALDSLWRERWSERSVAPGWIEARLRRLDDRPGALHAFPAAPVAPQPAASVDWFSIEDHTGADDARPPTVYEHVLVWVDRTLTTLTLRAELGVDLDPLVEMVAVAVVDRPGPERAPD